MSLLRKALYWARDRRARRMFELLPGVIRGAVLDIGGGDFVARGAGRGCRFDRWVVLEPGPFSGPAPADPRVARVRGDGCALPFGDEAFDAVLAIQVLEHVFEPIALVREAARVLRPGGHAVFLFPQTANLHLAPHHYQNLTRYWAERAAAAAGLEVVTLEPLGGAWSSVASRYFYFLLQAAGAEGTRYPDAPRKPLFYALLPFMAGFAAASIPVAMLFSLADMPEEANNHLLIARRP